MREHGVDGSALRRLRHGLPSRRILPSGQMFGRVRRLEYQQAGIPEYWMVDPILRTVDAYALIEGRYEQLPEVDGVIRSTVIPGLARWRRSEWR